MTMAQLQLSHTSLLSDEITLEDALNSVVSGDSVSPSEESLQNPAFVTKCGEYLNNSTTSLLNKSLAYIDTKALTNMNDVSQLHMSTGSISLTYSDYYSEDNETNEIEAAVPLPEPAMPPLLEEMLEASDDERDEAEEDLMINCVRGCASLLQTHKKESSQRMLVKGRRAQFANCKAMSVGRMEMTIDTVIKAHETPLIEKANRRLSFAYVMNQSFDETLPACAVAQGWVDRIEEWDPNPSRGDSAKSKSKPTKLKSILKTMKKRLSFGGGNNNGRDQRGIDSDSGHDSAPKRPGRRGSFQRALWTLPIRRSSFMGNDVTEDNTSDTAGGIEDARATQPASPKRRGSFFGRRFSNGGGNGESPPQKPGRRASQNAGQVERRGSFLGLGRRFSNNGDKSVGPPSPPPRRRSSLLSRCDSSAPVLPGRKASFLGSNHDSIISTDCESSGITSGEKEIGVTKNVDENQEPRPRRRRKARRRRSFFGSNYESTPFKVSAPSA